MLVPVVNVLKWNALKLFLFSALFGRDIKYGRGDVANVCQGSLEHDHGKQTAVLYAISTRDESPSIFTVKIFRAFGLISDNSLVEWKAVVVMKTYIFLYQITRQISALFSRFTITSLMGIGRYLPLYYIIQSTYPN